MIRMRAEARKGYKYEYGYEECDWIERDKVRVYQFDVDDSQKTTVTKLSCGEYGFEAITFYDTLEQLNRQTMIIEEEHTA